MAEITPMLQQYLRVKEEYPQTLVFFRLGDFYELFNDDALIASRELEIVLTGREVGAVRDADVRRASPCRHPIHREVVARGYRVSVCEQVEDPRTAKGLVAREVVRVYTPGTVVEEGFLPAKANNYLAAAAVDKNLLWPGRRGSFHGRVPRHRGGGGGTARRRTGPPRSGRTSPRRRSAILDRLRAGQDR